MTALPPTLLLGPLRPIFSTPRSLRPAASAPENGCHLRHVSAPVKLPQVAAPDQELMHAIGRGDRAACAHLVERHLNRILGFAERMLGNRGEAEEVAQEVFLRVWLHADRWRPTQAQVTTWLFRIARNLCLNRIAKRHEQTLEGLAEPPSGTPRPIEQLADRELGRHVNRALQSLPESQRMAITLCHYQGWTNAEAAEIMELSVAAVESLLARGRRRLKTQLTKVAPALLRGEA